MTATDHYIGQIRAFAFDYAPEGWMPCDGRLLPPSAHAELYSLLGTRFGGDGHTSFALPDLRGRVAMGIGRHSRGAMGGRETVSLTTDEMPSHSHALQAVGTQADKHEPGGHMLAQESSPAYATPQGGDTAGMGDMVRETGYEPANAHDNVQPSLVVNYCICVDGVYPSRD